MNASRGTRSSGRPRGNRIRKLLLSEYRELSETILVESPFAETTRNGRGIRQVALGLTPTRLIVAADILQINPGFYCPPGIDASIESFELVSVYPLEYVTLSVFRRRPDFSHSIYLRLIALRFVDGRANYYELGGARRRISWKIWCEQVRRLLAYKTNGSSLSETTAASSSSSSTLYLLSSEIEVRSRNERCKRSIFRVWNHYGGAGDYVTPTWTEKDLYLGPSYNELMNGCYTPVPVRFAGASLEDLRYELGDRTRYIACEKSCQSWPCQTRLDGRARLQRAGGLCNVLFARSRNVRGCDYAASCKSSRCNICQLDNSVGINVRGKHNRCHDCQNVLFEEDLIEHVEKKYGKRQQQHREGPRGSLASKISRFGFGVPEKCNSELILGPYRGDSGYVDVVDPRKLIESGVTIWEDNCRSTKARRHPRRYGFSSAAHFFHALGPWSVQPGERETVQTFRSPSAVNIRRQPSDSELRLPVSRRQLTTSVSCVDLTSGGSSIVGTVTRGGVILFWTPEYWYRPQAAAAAYRELRHHLASLQNFRLGKERQTRRKFFYRRKNRLSGENGNSAIITGKSNGLLDRVLSINGARKRDGKTSENADEGTAQLRRLLRMNLRITVWDLDSTTLAVQLTSIDRDLFVRVPATEIEALVYQRSSRNAPNLGAWIAFSHRIACLTVSEILAIKQLDMRTRIMARFINAADKCLTLGNLQSCRSILAGLQAPPIYRLRRSWSYLRTHHASRYAAMERLSKIYKSPRCSKYQRAWTAAKRNPPCMPYVGHFLIKVLGLNGLREIQADFARRQSITRINTASEFSTVNTSFNNLHSGEDKSPVEPKQSLARRILAATLARLKFTARQNVIDEIKGDVWTCKQRYLARKFFRRWRVITLESRIRSENERNLKNVDSKRRRVLDIAAWLTDCQRFALGYNFPLNSFACEYLLKARYREDRENFFISLKLEPPRTT
ncbi:PREDICTED: uncharacterized protein LOC105568916 [Vollenhovia emeryi]|uniref:uncharacterized protein LOC105568916 n=1 Tax=Vollenhovia emeryi TaxID=411798 RepID=UPI0005F43BB2|nr:PREDICTED: uncharacterized protein LOC105568916 [Vollenhovia emeryi]